MEDYTTRAWLEINLDNLEHNYKITNNHLSAGSEIMAIVKADGYGIGDIQAAQFFNTIGCRWFGVSNFLEARTLVENKIKGDVLQLGYTHPDDITALAKLGVTQAVVSFEYAQVINKVLQDHGLTLKVHIKVDTGMSRVGFPATDQKTVEDIISVFNMENLQVTGVFTHFAVADEDSKESIDFTKLQYERLVQVIEAVEERGYTFTYQHCCNSAGTVGYPEMHLNLVRPGSILYGLALDDPTTLAKNLPFKLVTSLKARISMVKTVQPGDTISYGRLFTASKPTKVATVTLGYADGYSRGATGNAYASLLGKKVQLIGRICMDQVMLDISHLPEVKVGDVVTFIGDDGVAPDSMEYARFFNSIDTEAITILGKRLPRLYFKNGKLVGKRLYV